MCTWSAGTVGKIWRHQVSSEQSDLWRPNPYPKCLPCLLLCCFHLFFPQVVLSLTKTKSLLNECDWWQNQYATMFTYNTGVTELVSMFLFSWHTRTHDARHTDMGETPHAMVSSTKTEAKRNKKIDIKLWRKYGLGLVCFLVRFVC